MQNCRFYCGKLSQFAISVIFQVEFLQLRTQPIGKKKIKMESLLSVCKKHFQVEIDPIYASTFYEDAIYKISLMSPLRYKNHIMNSYQIHISLVYSRARDQQLGIQLEVIKTLQDEVNKMSTRKILTTGPPKKQHEPLSLRTVIMPAGLLLQGEMCPSKRYGEVTTYLTVTLFENRAFVDIIRLR